MNIEEIDNTMLCPSCNRPMIKSWFDFEPTEIWYECTHCLMKTGGKIGYE